MTLRGSVRISENAKDDGFWSVIDDGPTEDEKEAALHFDLYGHAEKLWKE